MQLTIDAPNYSTSCAAEISVNKPTCLEKGGSQRLSTHYLSADRQLGGYNNVALAFDFLRGTRVYIVFIGTVAIMDLT
jgi:hypothetical protein